MAKRKKKSGGGGFGKMRSANQSVTPMPGYQHNPLGAGTMLKSIRRITDSANFQSQEEMERFMYENVIGKTEEEIARIADEISPLTPVEQADRLIDELPSSLTDKDAIRTAREALAISPECLPAWLLLGRREHDETKAMEYFEEGIKRGKERFKNEIESVHEHLGLWGNVEARDLIRLMIEKAGLLQNAKTIDQAIPAYREILKWNPGDNCGARGSLLLILLIKHEFKDARALLDAYPNDSDTTMAWGCAFLSIVEMLERTGCELPKDETLEKFKTPQDFVNSFGAEFNQAKKDIKRATEINPFVPILLNEAGLFALEASDTATFGGPYEAIEYLHVWAILWHAAGLPMIFIMTAGPKNIKKHLKNRMLAEEILDISEQIKDYDGPPWWEELDESDSNKGKDD
jgi:tetratricopeptide (TPR) repeat protein